MLTSNTCTSRRACVENRGDGLKPVKMIDLSERKPDVGTARVCRILAIVAFFAVCTFFLGCTSSADSKQQKAQAAGPRAISVATAPVQRQDVPVYLSGLGAVTAFNTANIKSSVGEAFFPADGNDAEQLLTEADRRMYQMKHIHHAQRRARPVLSEPLELQRTEAGGTDVGLAGERRS